MDVSITKLLLMYAAVYIITCSIMNRMRYSNKDYVKDERGGGAAGGRPDRRGIKSVRVSYLDYHLFF